MKDEPEKEFIVWMKKVSKDNSKVRAVLRRSLAFDPGKYPQAYPYVEPFLQDKGNQWRRNVFYLIAGLWATSPDHEESNMTTLSLGEACANFFNKSDQSKSIEGRFIALLDSDADQLPYRLRQMITLLKQYPIDFAGLLRDLLFWNDERKNVQNRWAREFYKNGSLENLKGEDE